MSTSPAGGLQLAAVLADVRREIVAAATAAQGDDLRFEVSSVRVDLSVAFERTRGGSGGVKLWVVEAGAEASVTRGTTHVLSVELSPLSVASGRKPFVGGRGDPDEE